MLLHSFLCISAIVFAGTYGLLNINDDYKYEAAHSAWYKLYPHKAEWLAAILTCRADGAELAVPSSKTEAETLVRLAGTALRPLESNWGSAIWVDISDLNTQGNYTTRTGIPVGNLYNRWHPGEPSHDTERCAFLYPDLDLWDHICNAQHYFICKMTLSPTLYRDDPTCNFEKIDRKGYVYMSKGSGWYKVHHEKATWTTALMTCSTEDAELVAPATPEEAQTVLDLVGSNWRPIEATWGSAIWVGLSDYLDQGKYKTPEGIPNSKLFNRWYPGEPNYASEHCAFLYPGLQLWDYDCNALHYFVCKKRESYCNYVKYNKDEKADYTYKPEYLASYKMLNKTDWTTAMLTCMAEGSELAVPNSIAEAQTLVQLAGMGTLPLEAAWGSGIWVDVTDFVYKRYFMTKDGTPIIKVYNRWHPGEPNDATEHCTFLYPDLELWDHYCEAAHYFICKINHNVDSTCYTTQIGFERPHLEFRDDYAFVVEQEAFYKVHHKKAQWGEALLRCWHEGAELLSLTSLEEASVVMGLVGSDARPIEKDWGSGIWVAVNDYITLGHYLTINGTSLLKTFNRWHPGEPNHASERCAFLYPGLELWDHQCSVPHYFVCKKSVGFQHPALFFSSE